jgi:hypothetical protein
MDTTFSSDCEVGTDVTLSFVRQGVEGEDLNETREPGTWGRGSEERNGTAGDSTEEPAQIIRVEMYSERD